MSNFIRTNKEFQEALNAQNESKFAEIMKSYPNGEDFVKALTEQGWVITRFNMDYDLINETIQEADVNLSIIRLASGESSTSTKTIVRGEYRLIVDYDETIRRNFTVGEEDLVVERQLISIYPTDRHVVENLGDKLAALIQHINNGESTKS